MKIGIDARSLLGEKSGVGNYTYNLIKHLSKIDRENYFFLCSSRDFGKEFFDDANFKKLIKYFPLSNLWLQTRLPLELSREKIELFHGTNFIVPLFSLCPTVVTIYDLTAQLFKDTHKKSNVLIQKMLPFSICKSKKVIATSQNTKRDIIKHFHVAEEKVSVIYGAAGDEFSPINDKEVLNMIRQKYELPLKFIMFLGTLEPRKNIETLLEAFNNIISKKAREYQLVIVGGKGWNWKNIYKRVVDLNLSEKVTFLGHLPSQDLPAVYNLADLFVYPSLYEGFGLPPLEAMACGTPVIISNVSSLPEVVGEAGVMVDPKNIQELTEAIEKVLEDNKLRAEMRTRGLERARQFSWYNTARETLKIYEEAL